MKAYKARYYNGTVQLLEQPPKEVAEENSEVVVVFPEKGEPKGLHGIPAKQLSQLVGIFSLGGDAVKDSDDIYDK